MHEHLAFNGTPVVGFGEAPVAPPIAAASPWGMVVATSVVGAAASWVIEEFASKVRRRRR